MEYNKMSAEQGLKDLRKEAKPKEEDKTYLNAEVDKYKRRLALVESAIKKIQQKKNVEDENKLKNKC
jgi:predicted outer membrane protein